jgi:dTDP-alpha-D-glucuronic acid decarboxylase
VSASRVLVTGGWGFIGSHLVERLIAGGDEVTVLDGAPPPGHLSFAKDCEHVVVDIRDRSMVTAAITSAVDVVYHLAAVVGVDRYLARPLDVIDVNFTGTLNVLEAATQSGARVVMASTSEVFGKNPDVPWREDSDRVLGPTSADRWAYSSSKALAEHLTLGYVRQRGADATIVRYFNVYGPRQRPAYAISRSVHRALNGRALVVYDQGKQTRSFTFVDDAVAGTLLAARSPDAVGEIFNLGNMVETTVGEVVELVANLTGSSSIVEVDTRERLGSSYEDLMRRVPDSTKARDVLNWKCETQLEDGLAKTIDWARANQWWLDLADSGAE